RPVTVVPDARSSLVSRPLAIPPSRNAWSLAGSLRSASSCPAGMAAKASLVGANTVTGPSTCSASFTPASVASSRYVVKRGSAVRTSTRFSFGGGETVVGGLVVAASVVVVAGASVVVGSGFVVAGASVVVGAGFVVVVVGAGLAVVVVGATVVVVSGG